MICINLYDNITLSFLGLNTLNRFLSCGNPLNHEINSAAVSVIFGHNISSAYEYA